MFVLFWVTVLFAVKGEATETGLCDEILCSPVNNSSTDKSVIKYKCGPPKSKVNCSDLLTLESQNKNGQVFKTNSKQNNCNININNTKTESESYQFRVDGILNGDKIYLLSNLTTINVKDLTAGPNISLICTPGLFNGSDPQITLMWTSAANNDNNISISNLTLTLLVKHNGVEVTCKVNFTDNMTLNVTFQKNEETAGSTVMTNPATQNSNTTKHTTVAQTTSLTSSNSRKHLGIQSCVCVGEGFSPSTIKWQLLENHTEHHLITTVLNNLANCTITLTTENSSTDVQCVSKNETGLIYCLINIVFLLITDPMMRFLCLIKKTEIICAFLTGVLLSTILSTIFCCLIGKCCRKKQRAYGNVPEATGRGGPLVVDEGGGDVAAGRTDVDYSTIKFSVLKRQTVKNSEETTETEYAEIKRGETEEQQAGEGIQEEVLIEEAVLTEVEAVLVVEAEETNHYVPVMGEGEDVVLPSNVTDIVNEI
ncbi:uncharacterized protein LOC113169043 [Anabas testudineus]|uniref:uncharacterized protein LOC113169043 n=1 Tax=Anabas testudineus TaxID=64144 RepID=UPI000E459B53|nr:uncharacterized protein LOC113169043 [Anabas testudineus]